MEEDARALPEMKKTKVLAKRSYPWKREPRQGCYLESCAETERSLIRSDRIMPILRRPLADDDTYPYDWGFVPSTTAEDGDPLDVLIIHDAQTYPGVVLRCILCPGNPRLQQKSKGKKERNDRVFAVPHRSPLETDLLDIRRLPSRAREELEEFCPAHQCARRERARVPWAGAAQITPSRPSSGYLKSNIKPSPEGRCRRPTRGKQTGCSKNTLNLRPTAPGNPRHQFSCEMNTKGR